MIASGFLFEQASRANLSCILRAGLKVFGLNAEGGRPPENPWHSKASPRNLGWLQLAAQ